MPLAEKSHVCLFVAPHNVSVDLGTKNRVTLYRLEDDTILTFGEQGTDIADWPHTTLGEVKAWLQEKRAQAEAAEVAAREATPPVEPPPSVPELMPPSDGPVTSPVTREADTTSSPGDKIEAPAAFPAATEVASPGSTIHPE